MTALANLLDTAEPPSGDQTADPAGSVEDRLLRHERRYWLGSAGARGLHPALSESTLLDALAAAMLLGAGTRDDADALLQQLPALEDQTRDRRDNVRDWIAQLYPPGDARPWGSLQPDRLAERFVGIRLQTTPELVDPLLAGASTAQITQLLTVYARAAHHRAFGDRLGRQLSELCVRHSAVLAGPAIDIATQVEAPGPLVAALRQLTAAPQTTLHELTTMAKRLPPASHNLAPWAGELARRLVDEHRHRTIDDPDAFLPDLAMSLNNLSVDLGGLGRWEEALAAVEEAVTVYRGLAAVRPDVFLPDLAGSLNNLAIRLGELGRWAEGLAAIEEAVAIHRGLAAARPEAFLPDLATSLNNLAIRLRGLGRWAEGLAAIEEAVAIHRGLATARPDAFLPDLAMSLNSFSVDLGGLGRWAEGLAAIEEAVVIRRELAARWPEAHQRELEQSLTVLGLLTGLGDDSQRASQT